MQGPRGPENVGSHETGVTDNVSHQVTFVHQIQVPAGVISASYFGIDNNLLYLCPCCCWAHVLCRCMGAIEHKWSLSSTLFQMVFFILLTTDFPASGDCPFFASDLS